MRVKQNSKVAKKPEQESEIKASRDGEIAYLSYRSSEVCLYK